MEYKKKSCFVLLSTLLLTFLLGLSGNAYAWTYNEVKGTIENVIVNSGYNNVYLTNLNTWIHSEVAEEWSELYNYDNFMIMNNLGSVSDNISNINHAIIAYAWNNPENDYNLYENKYSSSNWELKTTIGITKVTFSGTYDSNWNNNNYYSTSTSNNNVYWGFGNRNNPPLWVIFTDKIIMANSNGGTATQNWNTSGKYVPDYWTFTPYNDYGRATINGQSQWTYDVIDSIYNQPLGTIKDSLYVRKIRYRYGTWNGTTRTYVNGAWQTLYDYNRNGTLPTYFSGSTTHDSSYVYTTRIDLNTNGQDNNVLQLEIISSDPDIHPNKVGYYYIRDNHTALVNGVLYPNNTFSGDYQQQYNDQQQTNTITGTITDSVNDAADKVSDTLTDDSEVEGMLGDLTSGDTNAVAGNFGFSPIDNPFVATIRNVAEGVTDVLLGSGNATVTIGWHDYSYTLRSQDFTLPSNAVVTLIHLICNGFFIWGIYKYGFKLYQWINSGRLQNLVNEANDHQYFWF